MSLIPAFKIFLWNAWLFFLFLLFFTAGTVAFADFEEKGLIEQFSDAYRDYRERTPRWIGMTGKK